VDLPSEKDRTSTAESGPAGRGGGRRLSEATPIVVNDTLYMPTPYSTIVALNPETGDEIWTYKFDKGRPAPRGCFLLAGR
jgi:glucose dehydrogenase